MTKDILKIHLEKIMLCINIPKTCSLNWHRMSVNVQSIRESCIIWGWGRIEFEEI